MRSTSTCVDVRRPDARTFRRAGREGAARLACLAAAGLSFLLAALKARGQDYDFVKIADTSGPFASFGDPSINDAGDVAFAADLDGGRQGLFVFSGGAGRRVVLSGDALDGSLVTNVVFGREGLNDSGQLAFHAQLADGRTAVFRATPRRADG